MFFSCCNIYSYISSGNRLNTGGGGCVERDLCWIVVKDDLLDPTEVVVVCVVEKVE